MMECPTEGCEPWAWVEQREVQRRVGVLLEAGRAWGLLVSAENIS